MKKISTFGFILVLLSCQLNADDEPFGYMFRTWEWDYSLYKGSKITQQTLGYTQQFKYGNDIDNGNFFAFYRAEKLLEKYKQIGSDKRNSKTVDFNLANGKSMRVYVHFLGKKVDTGWTLETTNLYTGSYSSAKDTVRHFYKMRSDIP